MIIIFLSILLCITGIHLFMRQTKFGQLPSGNRAGRILKSPNYKNGSFQNLSNTPDLTEGANYYKIIKEFLFRKSPMVRPAAALISAKTDLLKLDLSENVLVWFGHSSYFLQVDGKRILVDPIFSGNASPVKFTTKSYAGSDVYTTDDIPEIDYLFISHDHWDHLDYETIIKLKAKIGKVITGLGTGQHFERWGFNADLISENDWYDELPLGDGFQVITTPARHFSGRGHKRNQALWVSFVLKTPSMKFFMGGDSGYDTHYAEIARRYGPFDLAILECGQYNKSWKYIHMMPEEVAQAAADLKARCLLPVHWAKFALAQHNWDEPIIRVQVAASEKNIPIIHPMIGEKVNLQQMNCGQKWWESC